MDNRISLAKLEVFRQVVELGGVVRAAEHLHLTQPVVSGHIRSLGQRMGTRLFARQGRGLALTEAGRVAYEWACDVARRTDELDSELGRLSDGLAGRARLWAGPTVGSFLLPGIIADFAVDHPAARITMEVGHPQHVSDAVASGDSDFGVLVTDVMPTSSALRSRIVAWEEMILVARASSAHTTGGALAPGEFERVPFVAAPPGTIMRDLEDRQLAGAGYTNRDVRLEVGHPQATLTAVGRDIGLALLFRSSAAQGIADGRLQEIEVDGLRVSVPVVIISRARARPTALQAALITEIAGAFPERNRAAAPIPSADPDTRSGQVTGSL